MPDPEFVALAKSQFALILHPDAQAGRSQTGVIDSKGSLDRLPRNDLDILIQAKEGEHDAKDHEVAKSVSDERRASTMYWRSGLRRQ
jgi:hypothetical protein